MTKDELKGNLEATVRFLSEEIGPRSHEDIDRLNRAAEYIEKKLLSFGCSPRRQVFTHDNRAYLNVIGEVKGRERDGILVIGAHYDTVATTPGADDNASGVAGMLELARLAACSPLPQTVRFAAFSLEEPPVFRTSRMGSLMYAQSLKQEGARVEGMVSLEMIGYYNDSKGSQLYPLPLFRWFYPDRGDFIGFVGNIRSRAFTKRVKRAFKAHSALPVESINTLSIIPGVDFSDHRSFWKFGFQAFMITDTAFYRNPYYHDHGDTASTLDYERMAELVKGLYRAFGGDETPLS
jgi:Zn-dependent M28 family amino/carboxypeptidase